MSAATATKKKSAAPPAEKPGVQSDDGSCRIYPAGEPYDDQLVPALVAALLSLPIGECRMMSELTEPALHQLCATEGSLGNSVGSFVGTLHDPRKGAEKFDVDDCSWHGDYTWRLLVRLFVLAMNASCGEVMPSAEFAARVLLVYSENLTVVIKSDWFANAAPADLPMGGITALCKGEEVSPVPAAFLALLLWLALTLRGGSRHATHP